MKNLRCWIDKELSRTALNDVAVVRVEVVDVTQSLLGLAATEIIALRSSQ